jgi:asparagine synthase (glutamine-hydrolysing)
MCGICGFVGDGDIELLRAMSEAMAHRGPDGSGEHHFPTDGDSPPAGLGHRRLSIIDPSPRGAQPMAYGRDESLWITYNGELYNFRALRRDLVRDGYSFRSDCDTEVMLAMYARHGPAMLDHLNGIFAFAIWDAERGELFLARDKLGVKPLYYAQRSGGLYFASEAKALLRALPRPGIREDALADYLTFLWVPDPDTIFDGIFKLPPGHCATFGEGRLTVSQYWDMTFAPEDRPMREWADLVRGSVDDSVRRQMVSDVPLGSFLSGGLDSSAVVASMKDASESLTTYTVGFSEGDLRHEIVSDDLRYARRLGRDFGLDYHEQILEPDVVQLLPRLVWHMDEPVADPAAITTYLICSAARERLTVILSGVGGDEIFAGYPRYLAARIGKLIDPLPRAARSRLARSLQSRLTLGRPGRMRGPRRNLLKLARGIDADPMERYLTYRSYFKRSELDALLAPDLRAAVSDHDPLQGHRDHFERVADQHWLNQLIYVDLKTFLPCLNLAYTDKMSMAASTEVRVPLLDDELVSLSGRVPPELKLHHMVRKYIFKRSMDDVLPRYVVRRRKAGFGAPVRSWLVGDLKPMIDDLLSPETVAARGLFDPTAVRKLVADNDAARADNALQIWTLLTLELWQQEFLDRPAQARGAVARGAA